MSIPISKTDDLAKHVHSKLKVDIIGGVKPDMKVLKALMETMFYASLKTEEGELLHVTVTLIDHESTDPTKVKRSDAWNFIQFEKKLPFDVKHLVKLAKAADPWSGSIAVYYDAEYRLWINGMIDQAIHNQNYLNFESDRKPAQPGILQVSIVGIGALTVFSDYEEIATLKQDHLIIKYLDVFNQGPVSANLNLRTAKLKKELTKFVTKTNPEMISRLDYLVKVCVKMVFPRILIKIQNYHHGGAILFTSKTTNLDVKYKINYDRLHRSMLNYLKYKVSNQIHNQFIEDDDDIMNQNADFQRRTNELHFEKTKVNNELKGTIRFIAAQSCVDGLVLIDDNLTVKGFGVVIKKITLPKSVWRSGTTYGRIADLDPSNPEDHGTRHRSIFSHCWNNTGSMGFVISQDGDVRAILKVEDRLVIWENIKAKQTRSSRNVEHSTRKISIAEKIASEILA